MSNVVKKLMFFKTEQALKDKHSKSALNISWQPEDTDYKQSEYAHTAFLDYFKFLSGKNLNAFSAALKETCETKQVKIKDRILKEKQMIRLQKSVFADVHKTVCKDRANFRSI